MPLLERLERFRSKACCEWTQSQAHRLWTTIKYELTDQQRLDIYDAWYHSRMDSDKTNTEFHATVNAVIEEIKTIDKNN